MPSRFVTETHADQTNMAIGDVTEEAAKERSYLWMARTFGLVSMAVFLANLILVVAVFSLLPLVRVQPFYISTQDKDQQIINIKRPPTETLKSEALQESFVRQYLVAYFGIGSDVDELERRWGPDGIIQWMSSDGVFGEFSNSALELIKRVKERGLTRNVRILNASVYPMQDGSVVWRSEVETADMQLNTSEPQVSKWTVFMEISFGNLRRGLRWENRLQNPLGFMVERFKMEPLNSQTSRKQ